MNDYPHLLTCTEAPLQSVVEAVVTRYADGPFRKAAAADDAYRNVLVGKLPDDRVAVWESSGGLTPGPSRIEHEIKSREPEIQLKDRNQMWPGKCPTLASTHVRLALDLDVDKNQECFDDYVARMPGAVARMFPVVHSECDARIEWLDGWVEGPDPLPYKPGLFAFSSCLVAQLAIRTGSKQWTEEHVRLAYFPALTPDGTFINRGNAKRFAMDDFGQQLLNLLGQFAMTAYERSFSAVPHDQLPTLILQDLYESS